MKIETMRLKKESQMVADIVGALTLFATMGMIALFLTNCTVSASVDWNGKSEVHRVTKSPEKPDGHTLW